MEDDATAAAAAEADPVSKVLGDDLFAEILLRVGFPTTLVRAAAVCKRWLHHASDKAFLRRFRELNPPRLLGFYIQRFQGYPRFVPVLPQPPEIAAAARIVGAYSFGACDGIRDSRNGSVFTVPSSGGVSLGLHSPISPERAMAIDPPLSPPPSEAAQRFLQIFSREEKGGGLSYFYVLMELSMGKDPTVLTLYFTARVSVLQDGVWCTHASATTQIPHWRGELGGVVVGNKIYLMPTFIEITVLDLTTSSFSTIQLPQGVRDFMISRADSASSVYLIGLKEHQLGIWLHKGDSWSIVDTICLHEMSANLTMSDCRVKDVCASFLRINHVGDNAEFVLLETGQFVLYLDMRCRTLRTLYEISQGDQYMGISYNIHPFMMIWPPTFPALKCDPTRDSM